METSNIPPRNSPRPRKLNWGEPKNSVHAPSIKNATVMTKRARRQEVDGAIGTGHPEMPADDIIRGLTRLARKNPRTATVREIGGVSFVLCQGIPVGMSAFRTVGGIQAFSLETGAPVMMVPCAMGVALGTTALPGAIVEPAASVADGRHEPGAQ